MSEDQPSQQEQLFIHLISSFSTTAWVGLGKIKNPLTDQMERNLEQASYAIDMLDMLSKKMEGNLSDWEKKLLTSTIGSLKLNYLEEIKKEEKEKIEKQTAESVGKTPPEPSSDMAQ